MSTSPPVVVKICMVPAVLGVFTPFPVPVCIGTISVVTLVGFTQIAEPSYIGAYEPSLEWKNRL